MKIALVIVLLLLLSNVLFLNYKVFVEIKDGKTSKNDTFPTVTDASPSAEGINQPSKIMDSCYPFSCIDLIREATASLTPKSTTVRAAKSPSASAGKEFYISFGTGQTLNDQWEDVPGLSAYIDSTKYGKIKTTTFEASLRIPTANGRVYAQLFNNTDAHAVWFSEVSAEGDKSKLVVSSPITLDPGNKLYKVQMKTSLKYTSILDQARVHIISE